MTELVKVEVKNGEQLISARELHEFLEVKRDFSTWIKDRINKYGFEEGVDFVVMWSDPKTGDAVEFNGNVNSMVAKGFNTNYILKISMAKELSMVENNDKGSIARKYFIECERKLKEVTVDSYMIEDRVERAKKWIEEQELHQLELKEKDTKIEQQQVKIAEVKDTVNKITEGVDVALLAKTTTDYVKKLVIRSGKKYSAVYNDIYELLGRRLNIDINVRHSNFCKAEEKKAIDNLKYNIENNLTGEDRIRPFRKSDTRYKISKLEYIVDILGKGMELFEVIAKLAEVKVDDVIGKYKLYEEEAK